MRKHLRTWIIIGVILLVLGGGGFAGYRYLTNLQATQRANFIASLTTTPLTRGSLTAYIGATGTIRTNQTAQVTWQTSGRVAEVKVKVGDVVKTDQVLATLDPTTVSTQILQAQVDLVNAQTALDELYRQSSTVIAQKQQALVTAQKNYDDAKTKRESMNYPRASQTQIDRAWEQYQDAKKALADAQEQYDKNIWRDPGDPARIKATNNLVSATNSAQQTLANYNWYKGKPTEKEFAEADAAIAVAQANLENAKRDLEKALNGPDEAAVAAQKVKITIAENTLRTTQLVAPFNGTIMDVKIKPGDLVSSSTVGFRIDDMSVLLIDLQVSEVDINRVKVNQKVNITFDAISDKQYQGVVGDIPAYGTTSGGTVNFITTIKITQYDKSVKPGMTASANILVDQVDNVLVVPNRAVRTVGNQRAVYVKTGEGIGYKIVRVRVGLSSDTMTEVISNELKEGDPIVTNSNAEIQAGQGGIFGSTTRTGNQGGGQQFQQPGQGQQPQMQPGQGQGQPPIQPGR
ncbi:MAG TPA: efflux RND transporter periplasmic adaptor subunit [Anaerolineaceae bacterium]